jgi:cell division septum initiation protein DivIVA
MFDQSLTDRTASEIVSSVQGKEFVLVRRGYDQDQVRKFLVETARAIEQLETKRLQAQREQEVLKGEVELLRAELESARDGSVSGDGDPFEQTGIRVAEILRSVNEDVAAMRREAEEATEHAKSDAKRQAHTFLHEAMEDLASGGALLLQEMEEARQRVADILDRLRTSIDEKAAMVEPAPEDVSSASVNEPETTEDETAGDDGESVQTEADAYDESAQYESPVDEAEPAHVESYEPVHYEPSTNGDVQVESATQVDPVHDESALVEPYEPVQYEPSTNGQADTSYADESGSESPVDPEPAYLEPHVDGEVAEDESPAYGEAVHYESPVEDEATHDDTPVNSHEPSRYETPAEDEPVLSEEVEGEPEQAETADDGADGEDDDDRQPILSFVVGYNPETVSPSAPNEADPNTQ